MSGISRIKRASKMRPINDRAGALKIISASILALLLVVEARADNLESASFLPITSIEADVIAAADMQQYKKIDQERIVATIGSGIQNRVQIIGHQINEVIGQGFQYKIHSDLSGNHVFITPTDLETKKIEVTIIYDQDKACDLTLLVEGSLSRSIIITSATEDDQINLLGTTSSNNGQQEAKEHLLQTMQKDRIGKYDREVTKELLAPLKIHNRAVIGAGEEQQEFGNLEIIIERKYGFAKDQLKGLRLQVKNKGKKWLFLKEDDLRRWFQGVELVHLTSHGLGRGQSIIAYIIRRDYQFGQNGD